jgi:small GTP-binding protein
MLGQVPDGVAPYKVVLLGDSRVGKTTLIAREVQADYQLNLKPTVGCHCNTLSLIVGRKTVTLQVWDTAGQEMYRALVPVYLRGASAAILVYDRTETESFQALNHWCSLLEDTVPAGTPIYLVANKLDLHRVVVPDTLGLQFATQRKAKFHKVSALTGDGVDQLFEEIAGDMLKTRAVSDDRGIVAVGFEKKPCAC